MEGWKSCTFRSLRVVRCSFGCHKCPRAQRVSLSDSVRSCPAYGERGSSRAFRRLVLSDKIGPLPCRSQRRMKLGVRCVITATLVCPPGGVNSGRSASLDMIHCVTHSGKEAPEGMRSSQPAALGELMAQPLLRSPREPHCTFTREQKGFFACQKENHVQVRFLCLLSIM